MLTHSSYREDLFTFTKKKKNCILGFMSDVFSLNRILNLLKIKKLKKDQENIFIVFIL